MNYLLNIGIAFDRFCAALIGWGYEFTISARCATAHKDCRFCKVVCGLLGRIWPNHCEEWAKKEGAE